MAIKSILDFYKKKETGEKITALTAYDFGFASLLANTSIDCILVGDSLGNVIQGAKSTLSVTLEDIIYHCRAVRRGMPDTFIVADLPFMTYQTSTKEAVKNSGQLISKGKADAVKLEGVVYPDTIKAIIRAGIPVMGHLGLTPQSIKVFGGHKVQGRGESFKRILEEAQILNKIGAFSIILEGIPAELGTQISKTSSVPTIGIGAGNGCDGQIMVLNDMLGMNPSFKPKFVRKFADLAKEVERATEEYCKEVRNGTFPAEKESYS